MSDSAKHIHHGIDYVEIGATDLTASRSFYEKAFGWRFNEYGPAYLGIQKPGGGEFGGLCTVCKVPSGGPLVILYSEDLAATLAAIPAAGGEIVKVPFSFPGGSRFHFKDPAGNELAVWSEAGGLPLDS